jgi:predicted DNA binding CopG/RHH family protein
MKMYTDAMRRAFHSIEAPKGFAGIELLDNDNFITIRLNEKLFANLDEFAKREAIQYVFLVKKALEDNGAVVLVVRKALGENK